MAAMELFVRAAVIGLGRAGAEHIRGYSAAGVEISAVCDINESLCVAAANLHNVPLATMDADAAIDAADIVSIASHDSAHARQVVAALAAGKHVMCEKPLCVHRDELQHILCNTRNAPGYLSTNMPLRYVDAFVKLKERIEAGELGEIYHVEATYFYGRLNKLRNGWRAKEGGYSVFLGGGIHMVDLVRWLTGFKLYPQAAVGSCFNAPEIDGPDTVSALFRLDNGATATITANFGCDTMYHHHEVRVYGTHDRACEINSAPTDKARGVEEFARAILRGDPPPISTTETIEAVNTCLDVDALARTRK